MKRQPIRNDQQDFESNESVVKFSGFPQTPSKTSNGHSNERSLKSSDGHQQANTTSAQVPCGRLFNFFSRTVGPLLIMFYSPNIVILLWYVVARCDGSWQRLFEMFAAEGFMGGLSRIWLDIHIASPLAVGVIAGYMVWALVLMVIVPGPRAEGPVTPKGNVPVYRDNGFSCFVLTMLAFGVLAYFLPLYTPYSVTIVYDHFDEFLGTLTVYSHFFCIFLHIKGLCWPSTSDCGTTGNLVFDYYWGTELYPRVFGVDIKVFTNCRFGMTVWALLVVIFSIKSYELHGFVDNIWVSTALQLIYITKFFWWEAGYMRTIDIMVDRAGFYICWGCLSYIAGFYTSVSLYLVSHPIHFGPFGAITVLVLGAASCVINYDADRQKLHVRRTQGRTTVWGRIPDLIRAQYQTTDGETRTSLLLVSGYWGISRHFHYLPELVLSFLWTVPAGFNHVMPYSYVIYLVILLVHRTFRDDTKCIRKYGEYWSEYCRRVPYKIVPYIF